MESFLTNGFIWVEVIEPLPGLLVFGVWVSPGRPTANPGLGYRTPAGVEGAG